MAETQIGQYAESVSDGPAQVGAVYPEGMTMTQWTLYVSGALKVPVERAEDIVGVETAILEDSQEQRLESI
ncbi:MAG: hypothetical protein ACHQT9_00405 [Candidatus Saccharimonadales bacterium]